MQKYSKEWFSNLTPIKRQKIRERMREYNKKRRQKQGIIEKDRECSRRFHKKNRLLCLNYYSNNDIKCACCGEREIMFMAIDHIENNGAEHRLKTRTPNITSWLVRNNFPDGFQILCHNCNQAKAWYGSCPHIKK